MRAPTRADDEPLFQYTLMPSHIRGGFRNGQLRLMTTRGPFSFTKGCPVMKIPASEPGITPYPDVHHYGTMLFDLDADPEQMHPVQDAGIERRMIDLMVSLMKAGDAPPEQAERLGLTAL